jgi:hypothetical protein
LETGRLEMPFPHPLENGCGYYLVCPEEKAEASQVRFFRDWIVRETARPGRARIERKPMPEREPWLLRQFQIGLRVSSSAIAGSTGVS